MLHSNERGGLMLEAIMMVGLLAMMSPMAVRQANERQAEMEDAAAAGQVKVLKTALERYIQANFDRLMRDWDYSGTPVKKDEVPVADLKPYIPAAYLSADGNSIANSKLVYNDAGDNWKFGLAYKCSVPGKRSGTSSCTSTASSGEACCEKGTITGLVISNSSRSMPSRQAARIATMVGSDGGFMSNIVTGGNVRGSQGMWETGLGAFGVTVNEVGPDNAHIGAVTAYAASTTSDFLYRRPQSGIPDANSMFTDIDMGGNGQCKQDGTGCNKLTQTGGVEVISGRIIVRNTVGDPWNDRGLIDIGLNTANINTTDNFLVNTKNASLTGSDQVLLTSDLSTIRANPDGIKIDVADQATINMDRGVIEANAVDEILLTAGGDKHVLELGNDMTSLYDDTQIEISSNGNVDLYAGVSLTLNSDQDISIEATRNAFITGKEALLLNSDKYVHMKAGDKGITVNSSFSNVQALTNSYLAHTDIVGGLFLNTSDSAAMTLGPDRESAKVLISEKGFFLSENGLKKYSGSSADVSITTKNRSGYIFLSKDDGLYQKTIELEGDTGIVRGTQFEQTQYIGKDGKLYNAVYSITKQPEYGEDGKLANAYTVNVNTKNALYEVDDSGKAALYKAGSTGDTDLNSKALTFHVDPAFTSVMNDIRITSRGSARLSQILPNYITKGIYILDNSYIKGSWPCDACITGQVMTSEITSNCSGNGGVEMSCDLRVAGTGYQCSDLDYSGCSNNLDSTGSYEVLEFSLSNSSYQSGTGWAHPYMGAVPKPGKTITGKDGTTISAEDEGNCPQGYLPVMMMTPYSFELGGLSQVKTSVSVSEDSGDYVGEGLSNWNEAFFDADNIVQGGTQLLMAILEHNGDDKGYGWDIAMGAAYHNEADDKYYWNGGAYFAPGVFGMFITTFCYFNPSRFYFPNVKFKHGVLTPIESADDI
ncbi:MAG: shufflon system plasmid conjugative transfer pilus tip adhesin PilV [Alphaproteobacteria bacterium]|nr:shufflon system plasmid conjugative transfer pilus tip adhesin PilV [Alphaproteobacteria bacterium]